MSTVVFERKFQVLKTLLTKLDEKPQSWTALMVASCTEANSPYGDRSMLAFLEKYKLAKHPRQRRGKYTITEKGRRALKHLADILE